jgi:hypothetical protein
VRLAALAPPAAGQRPEALAGEAGAALPLRPPLLSSLLGPGCIHLSPSLASSRVRPCPPCACAVVGAIHREQAVATRIRSRRYTICCRSRTLLVRPRCVPIMKSARCVSLQAHDSMCARQVRGRAGSGTAVVGAAGADGWDKSSRRYAA